MRRTALWLGCAKRQYSAVSLAISSEISEIKAHIIIQDAQSLVGFSMPKCMTLNH